MTKTSDSTAAKLKLGKTGPEVHPLGFGCMGMSGAYGATDDQVSIKTIHAAIERGVTLFDTGDFYAMGHNEMLLGRAIEGRRDKVQISVKFGALRGPDNSWGGMDSRPAAVKNFLAYSLKRLKVEVIDIYRPARLDPAVPIEETVGAIAEMIKAGFVKHIGLSEVGVETIRRAHKTHPIVDLQIEYSLASRGPEEKIFPVLAELGISATLYGVLSRGLLSGSKANGPGDFRAHSPRFTGENVEKNAVLVNKLHDFAKEKGLSAAQLSIAWVRAKEPALLPVIGIKTIAQLDDSLGAIAYRLSPADVARLDELFPPNVFSGGRYAPQMMHTLDSEK